MWSIIMVNNAQANEKQELVECEICLQEIPVSEAINDEATDYVMHYCGLECYEKWKNSGNTQD